VRPGSAHLVIELADKRLPGEQVGVRERVGELTIHKVKSINISLSRCAAIHKLLINYLGLQSINLGTTAVVTNWLGCVHHSDRLLIRLAFGSTLGLSFGPTSFSIGFGSLFSELGKILLREFDLTIIIKLDFSLLLFSLSITCTLALLKFLGINGVTNSGHGFSLAIRNEVANHFLRDKSDLVDNVESASFELEDSTFLEVADTALSNGFVLDLWVFVDKVFNIVGLFNFGFGDQVIVLNQSDFDGGLRVGGHPSKLLGLLEIFIGFVDSTVQHKVGTISFLLSDGNVTPLHEGNLITDLHISGIIALNPSFTAVKDRFGAYCSVFLVKRLRASFNWAGAILDVQLACGILTDASVARHNRINDVFVSGPNFVPLHQTSVAGGSLL
jgi:hypothetical protein